MEQAQSQNQQINSPSVYTQLLKTYTNTQFKTIQKLLRSIAYNCHYNAKYPILKILQTISQKMLINEFQSVIFAYILENNMWDIQDKVILQNTCKVSNIPHYSNQSTQYKSLVLYALLCAYLAKSFCIESMEIYDKQTEAICRDFKLIFINWMDHHANNLQINPRSLNSIYKQMYLQKQAYEVEFDQNSLVDALLQISPSYHLNTNKQKRVIPNADNLNPLNFNIRQSDSAHSTNQDLFPILNIVGERDFNDVQVTHNIFVPQVKIEREAQQSQQCEQRTGYQYLNIWCKKEDEESECDLLFRKKISTMSGANKTNDY